MKTVLSINSVVVDGAVGGSAASNVFAAFGVRHWLIPTVTLSNHPGHGASARLATPADRITALFEPLRGRGRLDQVDAVVTGYFVSAEQAAAARDIVQAVKAVRPDCLYLCDPIMGDTDKGVYVADDVPGAIIDQLIPIADIITPNSFEYGQITGQSAADLKIAASALAGRCILTSPPGLSAGAVFCDDGVPYAVETEAVDGCPLAGAGDIFAACYLSATLAGAGRTDAVSLAAGAVYDVMKASIAKPDLDLLTAAERIVRPQAEVSVRRL